MTDVQVRSRSAVGKAEGASAAAGGTASADVSAAQGRLNEIAGYARYAVSGQLDAQTRSALESFQASADLPMTGEPDGATLAALHREAGRTTEARAALDHQTTEALDAFDEAHPVTLDGGAPVRPSTAGALLQRSILGARAANAQSALARPADALQRDADAVRGRFGVPGLGVAHRYGNHDGWRVEQRLANGQTSVRFIGLLRHVGQGNVLVIRTAVDRMSDPATARHVENAIQTMEERTGRRLDRSLVIAIATREANDYPFNRGTTARCSYHRGGLDDLYGRRERLNLPPEVVARIVPATDDPRHWNERSGTVGPADVQDRDLMMTTAACVALAERTLDEQIRDVFGADGESTIANLSPDTRRAWVQIVFGASGDARSLMTSLHASGRGLDAVLSDADLARSHHDMRGRATAADASLFERHFTADP